MGSFRCLIALATAFCLLLPSREVGARPDEENEPAPRSCTADSECAQGEVCDETCVLPTEYSSPAAVTGGAVLIVIGGLALPLSLGLIVGSVDVGGGESNLGQMTGGGAMLGLGVAGLIAGSTLVGLGTREVPVGARRAAVASRIDVTPVVGPGFTGVQGTF